MYNVVMLKTHKAQPEMEFVYIDELVPKDHLLRKITKAIDFEFIREKVRHLYCADNGRPPVDPVVLFKMLFIGYLFGIRSERQLMRDIEVNVAYRWFVGFTLREKIPHASTISQNRRRRFNDSEVYQEIFDEIVLQAMRKKMVDGRVLYTDSTHIKADANKHKFTKSEVRKRTSKYLDELDEDVESDRKEHGKKPLKPPKDKPPETKVVKKSTTDPDSGYMVRDGKPKGFFYLDHRTVDAKHAIITDVLTTAANIHDSVPYLDRLERQIERFGFNVEAVGLDAGYFTAHICKSLEDKNIYGTIGYRRPNRGKGLYPKRKYTYNPESDTYRCPAGETLPYRTTTRQGFKHYISDPKTCRTCTHLTQCTKGVNHTKIITRHIWQESKDRVDAHRLTEHGKRIYVRRKETVERSFADAKELHGHRYAKRRGLKKVNEQALLCAAVQNMKKMALHLSRSGSLRLKIAATALDRALRGLQKGRCWVKLEYSLLLVE